MELITKTRDSFVSKKYLETALKCYDNDEISKTRLEEYLKDAGINLADLSLDEALVNEGDEFAD
jgi:hypothetical protein